MAKPLQISVETEKNKWFNIYINDENELVICANSSDKSIVLTMDEWRIIQKYANQMVSDFNHLNKYPKGDNPF
jgi:hypothetical protein